VEDSALAIVDVNFVLWYGEAMGYLGELKCHRIEVVRNATWESRHHVIQFILMEWLMTGMLKSKSSY
jgi:hypothetical protein